jgi:hypothetical protein
VKVQVSKHILASRSDLLYSLLLRCGAAKPVVKIVCAVGDWFFRRVCPIRVDWLFPGEVEAIFFD